MKIEINKNGTALTIIPEGRLDTITSPEFENTVIENITGITDLTFDLNKVVYLSSAGIRVFMRTQKIMLEQGQMELVNVKKDIMEVFEMVGLTDVMTIR